METVVGSQRHRSPGVGGGVPASLSGGGLPQSTSECTKSTFTVSRRAEAEGRKDDDDGDDGGLRDEANRVKCQSIASCHSSF